MLIKKITVGFLSLIFSMLLIISIPTVNFFLNHGLKKKEYVEVAKISLKKVELQKKKETPRKKLRKPQKQKPTRSNLKAGPRFAMDLGVSGSKGVAVDVNTVNAGAGGQLENGDVDEKPRQNGEPGLELPPALKEAGINAMAVISFCVDAGGNPYDLQTVEESPAGLGMAESARKAIRNIRFTPAQKDGRSVAFCGMQQPFEVRFD